MDPGMDPVAAGSFFGRNEGRGRRFFRDAVRNKFGGDAAADFDDAVDQARASGVGWVAILLTLLTLLPKIIAGNITIAEIVKAILDLIKPV